MTTSTTAPKEKQKTVIIGDLKLTGYDTRYDGDLTVQGNLISENKGHQLIVNGSLEVSGKLISYGCYIGAESIKAARVEAYNIEVEHELKAHEVKAEGCVVAENIEVRADLTASKIWAKGKSCVANRIVAGTLFANDIVAKEINVWGTIEAGNITAEFIKCNNLQLKEESKLIAKSVITGTYALPLTEWTYDAAKQRYEQSLTSQTLPLRKD